MITKLDFETYFDSEVTLKKMPIDVYVAHPKFKIHGVTLKVDDGPIQWFRGKDTVKALKKYAGDKVVCHNAWFDAYILNYWYKIKPKFLYDTMAMARALYGSDRSASLASIAEYLDLGVKKTELLFNLMGVENLEGDQETTFVNEYAIPDVRIMDEAFKIMIKDFPQSELDLIDVTIRMFTEPALLLNEGLLEEHLGDVQQEKRDKLLKVRWILEEEAEDEYEAVRAILASNPQFAALLEKLGIKVPMKKSPTAVDDEGKPKTTFAFSKKDTGFTKLLEHKDERIKDLANARLAAKSTLEETRTKTFISVAKRPFPVPLMYYGAHTGRFSGGTGEKGKKGGRNLQNLGRESKIRKAIEAPDGYVVCAVDSAQIEARGVAWFAEQADLVEDFALDRDPYSVFATELYGYPVSKADKKTKIERYVGKTCILGLGYGMGGPKLQWTLETGIIPVKYTEERCHEIVRFYRQKYERIPILWRTMQEALPIIHQGKYKDFGPIQADAIGIRLPNGLYLRYNGLRKTDKGEYEYYGKYMGKPGWVKIYGGKVVENVIQALARIIVMDQLVEISRCYKVCLTVHDEVVALIPEKEADEGLNWMLEVMSKGPEWSCGWPVACEGGYAKSYGDVK